MDKIIKVIFEEWQETQYDNTLTQWDYGHTLQVEGVTLPDGNIEVHFSLTDYDGEAPVYIGYVKNNVLTVEIPDFILQKENVYAATYEAYAWIYFTDGDFGETKRKIVFTIEARSEPTAGIPEDKKEPFLDEVRKIMNETKEVAQSVRDDADAGKFNGKDGKDGKDGESGTSQIDEEQLLQFAIKSTTEKAPSLHITDSANYRVLDFGMEGITEQESTSGKNLLKLSGRTVVSGGWSGPEDPRECTGNKIFVGLSSTNYFSPGNIQSYEVGENYVTVNSNSTSYGIGLDCRVIPEQTYIISPNVHKCIAIAFYDSNGSYVSYRLTNTQSYFTAPNNAYWAVIIFTTSENNVDTVYENVQLEIDTTVTDYEPFTNGPSPNPDYPQEIVNAGVYNEETGRYEHKCCVGNKNWFDKEWIKDRSTYDVQSGAYYRKYFYLEPNTQYKCVRTKPDTGGETLYTVFLATCISGFDNGGANGLGTIFLDGAMHEANSFVFTTGADGKMIIKTNATGLVPAYHVHMIKALETANIMIYKYDGVADDTYVPHASQPLTLTSDRPLTMWDKLVKRDGVWGWSIWSIVQTFDGSEDWQAYGQYKSFYIRLGHLLVNDVGKCTHYGYGNFRNKDLVFSVGGGSGDNVWIHDERFYNSTDLSEFKTWLAENNVTVTVQTRAEVAFIPLPEEEQILLNNLETYYGVTNVYNEQGCPMWLTYVNDTKLYVDKKLLEIQQAMI